MSVLPTNRIVIIGSGFAGVWSVLGAVKALEESGKTGVEIVVVSPEPSLVVRPRLYETDISGVKTSVAELFESTGARHIQGWVTHIRTDKHTLDYVVPGSDRSQVISLQYNKLILASGSKAISPSTISGFESYAFSVDDYPSSVKLDNHLRNHLPTLPSSTARNTVVVAGAGFTGIEVATELKSRLRSIFGNDDSQIIILDRNSVIGPDLGPGPRPTIQKALDSQKITVYISEALASVHPDFVTTSSGRRIETNTLIWAGGMRASELTQQLGLHEDKLDKRSGRALVDEYLRVSDDVFATGDTAMALADTEGHYTLMSCQHAIPLGKTSGYNAVQSLFSLPLVPFSQPYYGTCLDLGEYGAILTNGWDRLTILFTGSEAKSHKININRLVYPPKSKEEGLAYADPRLKGTFKDDGSYELIP